MEWLYDPQPTELTVEARCCGDACETVVSPIEIGGVPCNNRSCGVYIT